MFESRIVVYDLEATKKVFIYGDYDTLENKYHIFVISEYRDDRVALKTYIKNLIDSESIQVGFNNLDYDYPMLHYLIGRMALKKWKKMTVEEILEGIVNKNNQLIPDKNSKKSNKFGRNYNTVHNPLIKQIDIFKINHWDNAARRSSLILANYKLI